MGRPLFYIVCISLLISCKQEIIPDAYKPRSGHDAYLHSLKQANLVKSALGNDWMISAKHSLETPIKVDPPHKEAFYFDPSKAEAVGYRFLAKKGQKILVYVTILSNDSMKLFIDLFRINNDSLKIYQHIASSDTLANRLAFEPRRDSEYILRVQPELLRGGRFGISILIVPSFTFPVSGKNSKSIGSFFGDPRDGGKREHHGVDIFAKRHTPVVAPTNAYVRRVGERGMGGKVIWLRDSKGQNLYFAHLQSQLVKSGIYVYTGDTIGTVGNTGNARTTPTHLHFGIYQNGPQNPINHIKETNELLPHISTDLGSLGKLIRTKHEVFLRNGTGEAAILDTLKSHELMRVVGSVQSYLRVILPNGFTGYLMESDTEPVSNTIATQSLTNTQNLLSTPKPDGIAKYQLNGGDTLEILANHKDYLFVRTSKGILGWVNSL